MAAGYPVAAFAVTPSYGAPSAAGVNHAGTFNGNRMARLRCSQPSAVYATLRSMNRSLPTALN